jgi:hypothetical protein
VVKLRKDYLITKVIDNIARYAIISVPYLVVVFDCNVEDEIKVMLTFLVNV